jgi:hypothetical protein
MERPREKCGGWKGQGLSKKGKEILIKSVIHSVSTYAMGCFQLLKGQCGQFILHCLSVLVGRCGGEEEGALDQLGQDVLK